MKKVGSAIKTLKEIWGYSCPDYRKRIAQERNLSPKHVWSLSHPLVKGNPFKAAILETVTDLAFLSLVADIFNGKKK